MIVRPMFNLVLLPDVNYYFKNDFLKDWSLFPIEEKEEILFLVLRENKPRAELQPDDFYLSECLRRSRQSRRTAIFGSIRWSE